jgi:conjugal transfer pilus assembly protein TraV
MKHLIGLIICIQLTACSMMSPYEENFGCRNKDKMGKCISPAQAYQEALSGQELYPHMQQDGGDEEAKKPVASVAGTAATGTVSSYQELEYRQLHALIGKSKLPLVSAPKVLRTLILSYRVGEDKSSKLYMPRFIYSFLDQGKFNLGGTKQIYQETLAMPLFGE